MAVLFVAAALFFLYKFAYGNGKVQREKKWAIWLYALGSMALTAKVFLSISLLFEPYFSNPNNHKLYYLSNLQHFMSYWLDNSSNSSKAKLVTDSLNGFLMGTLHLDSPTTHSLLKLLSLSNKIVEVVGIVAMIVGFVRVRDYLTSVSSTHNKKVA